ncbi:MAG: hypothetical protein ACHBN1_26725 [Heteroscytonema crispum UTEX LB 1556]
MYVLLPIAKMAILHLLCWLMLAIANKELAKNRLFFICWQKRQNLPR